MQLHMLCPRLVACALALATVGCRLDWSVPVAVRRSHGGKAGEGVGGEPAGLGGGALGDGVGGEGAAPSTTTTSSTVSTTSAAPDCDHGTCDDCQTCAMGVGGPCEARVAACTGACDDVWACEDGGTSCPVELTCGECFETGVDAYCALLTCVMFDVCATACTQEAQPTFWPYCSF